jgi:AcrR family transcriptional regulator
MDADSKPLARYPRVPPGRHGLSRDVVAQHQRSRILSAIAEIVAKRGYRGTAVSRIAKLAGVSRDTFYEHFANKEACFLAAFDDAVERVTQRIADAVAGEDSLEEQVALGLAALLDWVRDEPAMARSCIVEVLAAGSTAIDHYERTVATLAALIRRTRSVSETDDALPDTAEEVVVRGILWLLYRRLVVGETDGIGLVFPEMLSLILMPGKEDRGGARPSRPSEIPS